MPASFASLSRTAKPARPSRRPLRTCCEALENRRLLSVVTTGDQFGLVNGKNQTLQQIDGDGDIVQFSLTGGGSGQVVGDALVLSGTTPKSSLRIAVRKAGSGNGLATLTGITADGLMKSMDGPSVITAGDITLNTVAAAPAGQVAIRLNRMLDGSIRTGGEPISSLTLQNWAASSTLGLTQEVRAPWIGTLSVKGGSVKSSGETLAGDLASTVILDSFANGGVSLRTATIAGTVGDIAAAGAIGKLTAGAINGAITATTIGSVTTKVGKGSAAAGNATGTIRATDIPAQANKAAMGTVRIAGSATNLAVRTDMGSLGNVTINGSATGTQMLSVGTAGTLRVNGIFSNGLIQTVGGVKSITLGAMDNSNVLVGVAPTFARAATVSPADFVNGGDTVARLSAFTVGKSQAATAPPQVMRTNNISAAQLGNIKVFNMASVSPGSLQLFTLDGNPKSPATVRYTDNANPANSFNWRNGQTWPPVLQEMLTLV